MRVLLLLLLLVSLLVTSGCTSVSVMRLRDFRTRVPATSVDVYASKDSIKRKYSEMAILTYKTDRGLEVSLEKIKAKAAEIGAEGIILERIETNQQIIPVYGVGIMSVDETTQQAMAIVYE